MALHHSGILELRGVSLLPSPSEGATSQERHAVSLGIPPGRLTWLAGPAEGGKELLFRLLQGGETPATGDLLLQGESLALLSRTECAELRARKFGFVAAAPFLLPTFSAIENIAVPLMKVSRPTLEQAQERISELLRFVGLHEQAEVPAASLSPSEQVRLVLARALANAPVVLFVEDWPSSQALEETLVLNDLLRRSCQTFGVAVVAFEGTTPHALPGDHRIEIAEGRLTRTPEIATLPTP